METIQEIQAQTVEQAKPEVSTPQPKEPDLVTRVSQFKVEAPAKAEPLDTEEKFDFKELEAEAEKNPVLMKAYKSLQRGFNTKFQELAEIKKSLQPKAEPSNWTPEKVQSLMSDPAFVQAAQALAGPVQSKEPTDEEYSALQPHEKQKITQLEQELAAIKNQTLKAQSEAMRIKQDQEIAQKYGNYQPEAVDIITADLLAGKVQATREHLWKVVDYDDAVKRAYELGRQDRQLDTQEKVNSTSFSGVNAVNTTEPPKAVPGETNRAFWNRIATKALSEQGRVKS